MSADVSEREGRVHWRPGRCVRICTSQWKRPRSSIASPVGICTLITLRGGSAFMRRGQCAFGSSGHDSVLNSRPCAAAFLFFNFALSVAATAFAIKAIDEIRTKQREEYQRLAVLSDTLQFEPDVQA